jgi:Xaa-Pro aminopeptidase
MEENNLSGVVLLDTQNITYFTGFLETVQPFERPVATLLPLRGEPTMFLNEINLLHARLAVQRGSCVVADVRAYTEHPRVDRRLPSVKEWASYLRQLLREKGLKGRVGTDQAGSPLLRRAAEDAGLSIVSVKAVIDEMRLQKCEEELEIMRAAGRLLDRAQEYLHSLLAPDRLMAEVLYEAMKFLALEVARTYPDAHSVPRVSGWNGVDTAAPHGIGGGAGAILHAGDVVISLVLLQLNGYNVENERTYVLGEPTELQARAFRTMVRAQEAGAQRFRVGSTPAEIDGATQRVIEEAGFGDYIAHRACHGKGLGSHEYPVDTAYNYMPLPKGAVLSCEPGIYIPEVGGFRHSDNFIVTERGGEALTSYPHDLESLTVRL